MSSKEIHQNFFTVPKTKLRDTDYDSGYTWKNEGNGKWMRMSKKKENEQTFDQINNIRIFAHDILESSKDLLVIDKPKIEEVLLPEITRYLNARTEKAWLPEGHDLSPEQEIGLNLFLNVINFCYKDPETGHEYFFTDGDGKQVKRATGLLAAMARSRVDWNNFDSVGKMSVEEWREIAQISSANPMFLADERGNKIVGFAKHLLSLGFKSTIDFIEGCELDAVPMVEMLNKSGYFEDMFMKRSQLACRMINDVLIRRQSSPLDNINKLTVMADYRIPQVFCNLEVVNLDIELLELLTTEYPIVPESREEIALRATAVVIGKMVAEKMGITEAEVDNILWGLSQDMVKTGEMKIPHMIVATDAY